MKDFNQKNNEDGNWWRLWRIELASQKKGDPRRRSKPRPKRKRNEGIVKLVKSFK